MLLQVDPDDEVVVVVADAVVAAASPMATPLIHATSDNTAVDLRALGT